MYLKLKFQISRLKELYYRISKNGNDYARFKGVNFGENCRIYTHRFGTEPWLINIGNNVTITSNVILLTHDGSTWLMHDKKGRRYLYRKIEIGNNVFIGINSIIMPGVKIDDDVIVAAGSIVTKSVPKGSIVAGNPAVIIGNFYNYKQKVINDYISFNELDHQVNYRQRIEKILDPTFKNYMK
jgi:acetyltransferase-like isoleucine patch superfamily enzyme